MGAPEESSRRAAVARLFRIAAQYASGRREGMTREQALAELAAVSADPDLLAEHERSQREGAAVVMGHLPLDPSSPRNLLSWGVGSWAETRCARLTKPGAKIGIADLLTGQISIHRDAYEAVGGFDVSFTRDGLFGGEDLDLGYRLLKAGYRVTPGDPDQLAAARSGWGRTGRRTAG